MKRISTLLFTLMLVALASWAQSITPQEAVDRFVDNPSMKHASVGVMFMSIDSGKIIATRNPELSVVTASTMKTVTSTAALEQLGGSFRFETPVYTTGKIQGDTLKGNILIVGGGDPTLGTGFIKGVASLPSEITKALADKGIKVILGSILTDSSLFPTPYYSDWWDTGDLAQDYGAGVFPLNYRDNTIRFNFNIDRNGQIDAPRFSPNVPGLNVADKTMPGKRNAISTTLEYGTRTLALMGETAKSKSRHSWIVANPSPEVLLTEDVKKALADANITLANGNMPTNGKDLLLTHKSPELTEIVTSLLDRSDNMFTHALLRALAVRSASYKANGGDLDHAGVNEVKRILKTIGVDPEPLFMRDGSGLARVNRASVHMFCDMLRSVADKKYNNQRLTDLMPRAGKRIGKILPTTSLSKDVSLKSGSMSDVQCFVGYYPAENPTIVWAVLANNYTCSRSTLKDNIDRMLIGALMGQ